MKFPLPQSFVRLVGAPLVSALARSWRFCPLGEERWLRLRQEHNPFIFMLWHETLLPLLWRHRDQGIFIMVSLGREGQYVGDYARKLGYRLLPGSSERGGPRALLGAVRALEDGGVVAITPDGPKGPSREIKPGVVQAAQRVGAPIIPLHAVASRAWRAGSWDRLVIPKPGAEIVVGYGEPVAMARGPDQLAGGVTRCMESMIRLEKEMSHR